MVVNIKRLKMCFLRKKPVRSANPGKKMLLQKLFQLLQQRIFCFSTLLSDAVQSFRKMLLPLSILIFDKSKF